MDIEKIKEKLDINCRRVQGFCNIPTCQVCEQNKLVAHEIAQLKEDEKECPHFKYPAECDRREACVYHHYMPCPFISEPVGPVAGYQKCPICEGVGVVSGGFYSRAGDCNQWVSASTTETCRACKGTGLLPITGGINKIPSIHSVEPASEIDMKHEICEILNRNTDPYQSYSLSLVNELYEFCKKSRFTQFAKPVEPAPTQSYTLTCRLCGRPYGSREAFPRMYLCPECITPAPEKIKSIDNYDKVENWLPQVKPELRKQVEKVLIGYGTRREAIEQDYPDYGECLNLRFIKLAENRDEAVNALYAIYQALIEQAKVAGRREVIEEVESEIGVVMPNGTIVICGLIANEKWQALKEKP